jgi:hypothetical protein
VRAGRDVSNFSLLLPAFDNVDDLLLEQPQLVGRAGKPGGIPDCQRRRFADSGFST